MSNTAGEISASLFVTRYMIVLDGVGIGTFMKGMTR